MGKVSAVLKHTGEYVELSTDTEAEIIEAWRIAQEYAKVADKLKSQLKDLVPSIVGDKGTSEPINGFMFRVSNVQRMNYDKSVLRQVFDEDTLDLFLVPKKSLVDNYIKENLEELGDKSTELRQSMVEDGKGYQVIKLEKLDREQ